jgi:hypothetical protein
MKYYNTDDRYGDCGPFEAESKEALIDEMNSTFLEWINQGSNLSLDDMRSEFRNALEEIS